MFRLISLYLRRLQGKKEADKTIETFGTWKKEVASLNHSAPSSRKLLIIRLDDIGDYIIFRNTLSLYRTSTRWQNYQITLLGNLAWKPLYDYADSAITDQQIWLNKNEYYDNANYRRKFWRMLAEAGYEAVICPSRTRPLLLDDLCMMAAGATTNIGNRNSFELEALNRESDMGYTELYGNDSMCHEQEYNSHFACWCSNIQPRVVPLYLDALPAIRILDTAYIICFIGASAKSKRWPSAHWKELINKLQQEGKYAVVLSGGKAEQTAAKEIQAATTCADITGVYSLVEMAGIISNAAAVVSNDTMAAHMAVACHTPAIIISSGDNFYRFGTYREAGVPNVTTLYPAALMKKWKENNYKMYKHHVAVTNDIATISVDSVFSHLHDLLSGSHKH